MFNDFTLFLREYPNGKKVYFYYTRGKDGERRGPWTTKSDKRTEARNYCHRLLKNGTLIPDRIAGMTFGEYSAGFWERNSEYVIHQESRGDISDSYISNCKKFVANQIIPFFENVSLDKFTSKVINDWLLGFKDRKVIKDGKEETVRYKNTYANTVFGTLNVMLAEAVRRGILTENPCDRVKRLKNDRKEIKILTVDEVQKMFPDNYKTIWEDKELAFIANRLASLTGLRIGEILGLKGEYVFDDYIHICGQYGEFGYKNRTKTNENRDITLIPEMIALLKKLMKNNGKGFLFSLDGGATPVSDTYIRKAFKLALIKIGINASEIKRRCLTIHGWRHFVNTDLLRQGFTVKQVQGVTGHKSIGMTERYNHLDSMQKDIVMKAQRNILGKKKPEKPEKETSKTEKSKLKLVKMPVRRFSKAN
jgi:integrase